MVLMVVIFFVFYQSVKNIYSLLFYFKKIVKHYLLYFYFFSFNDIIITIFNYLYSIIFLNLKRFY